MHEVLYFKAGFQMVGSRRQVPWPLLTMNSPRLEDHLKELVDLVQPPFKREISVTVDQDDRVVNCENIGIKGQLFRGLWGCAAQGMGELIAARALLESQDLEERAGALVRQCGFQFIFRVLLGSERIQVGSETGERNAPIILRPIRGAGIEHLLVFIHPTLLWRQPLLPKVTVDLLRLHLWTHVAPIYGWRFRV